MWKFIVYNFKRSPFTLLNPIIMVPIGYTAASILRNNFNVIMFFVTIGIGILMSLIAISAAYGILKIQKKI